MSGPRRPWERAIAWGLFLAWAVWLSATQGLLLRGGAAWVPDLALVLAVVVLARAESSALVPIAFATALSRAATAGDAPLALLSGALAALLVALLVRGAIELSGPLGRTLAAGLAALLFHVWLAAIAALRAPEGALALVDLSNVLPVAISSAVTALVAGPLLARLPGLTPLRSRTW